MSIEQGRKTIARALTRKKTIKAQLDNIAKEISQYGTGVDKLKHPLSSPRLTTSEEHIRQSHNDAREYISKLVQQYNDLVKEYVKISVDIQRANLNTMITIGGQTMSIAEAQVIANEVLHSKKGPGLFDNINNAMRQSVVKASSDVSRYNSQYQNVPADAQASLLAQIVYLFDMKAAQEQENYYNLFKAEFNATLNEVNAVTEIGNEVVLMMPNLTEE